MKAKRQINIICQLLVRQPQKEGSRKEDESQLSEQFVHWRVVYLS
ncbi:hypothetical protein SAMN05660816_05526 [Niastella yeongjuensis]|nr:hypothetical protein SAMN05660816_05526 [Niastella yeongjuensis]